METVLSILLIVLFSMYAIILFLLVVMLASVVFNWLTLFDKLDYSIGWLMHKFSYVTDSMKRFFKKICNYFKNKKDKTVIIHVNGELYLYKQGKAIKSQATEKDIEKLIQVLEENGEL